MSDLCSTSADSCSSDSFAVDVLQWLVRDILATLCAGGVLMSRIVKRDFAIEKCATSYTSEAEPVDHRGVQMWSWTASQLRANCASCFYRLNDGVLSALCIVGAGADPWEPLYPAKACIAALSERRRLERVSGFLCVKSVAGIIPAICICHAALMTHIIPHQKFTHHVERFAGLAPMISYNNFSLVVSFSSSSVGCCADEIEATNVPTQPLLWGFLGDAHDAQSTMFWCIGGADRSDEGWYNAWQNAPTLAHIVPCRGAVCSE